MAKGALAQTADTKKPLVQFVSIVRSTDSNRVVPYANFTIITQKGVVYSADYRGYVAMIVNPGDTISVSAIGYAPEKFTVPLVVNDQKYTKLVMMRPQSIHLPDINILPWATPEELKQHVLTMHVADDNLEVARKNVSPERVSLLVNTLPLNSSEISSRNNKLAFYNMATKNMVSSSNYLSPLAWYSFIKSLAEGDESKKQK